MKTKTLYLAWQAGQQASREWFPIGRLDLADHHPQYRFQYIRGAQRAAAEAGFAPLIDFPGLRQTYESNVLFPLFKNRILSKRREDFPSYVASLDLPEDIEPIEILKVDGGLRETDQFQVFPKLEKAADGSFCARFFLHGWRHVNADSQKRLENLERGEQLYVAIELTNPVTQLAVQIQTVDYHMIGWAPRYLVGDLVAAIAESGAYEAEVVRRNPMPAPSKQRLLVELRGHWRDHQPMSSADYLPLVA